MNKLIEFRQYPLEMVLDKLLMDKTTGKRIIWATDSYSEYGDVYCDRFEITPDALIGMNPVLIQPRAFKALEAQQQRTKSKAEVFTPSWIVNRMVNHLDEEWFGGPEVFNIEENQTWKTNVEKIDFKDRKWKDYIDRSVLEITCGEAPFIVSRYNASTGEIIPIEDRIGVLDRKLRVVAENTNNEEDWIKWAKRAYESVYGYEYQGDNLLIGRINLLMTFVDHYQSTWKKEPDKNLLSVITNIITWNFWQMDGLNGTVPLGVPQPMVEQMTLFGAEDDTEEKAPLCKVRRWRMKKTVFYKEIEEKEGNSMTGRKFDVVIGNPPYQDSDSVNNRSGAVYQLFYDAARKISNEALLVTPARFLFNTGLTPKDWNQKMLNDDHFKIVDYFPKSADIFPSTEIKAGIVISYINITKRFSPIREFIPDNTLRMLGERFFENEDNISNIMYAGRSALKFNDTFLEAFPNTKEILLARIKKKHPNVTKLSPNEEYEIKSSTFDTIDYAFFETQPDNPMDFYQITGLQNGKRTTKWIKKEYLSPRYPECNNITKFKVFIPESNGNGGFGEQLSSPFVGGPNSSTTPTFQSIGAFDTKNEADNLLKYLKSKFLRALLGIRKKTQHNPPKVWELIPVQDFSIKSDIDWSKSIPEIDQQLYKKYGLSPKEIDFIETHVKEME